MTTTAGERARAWLRHLVSQGMLFPRGRARLPIVLAWVGGLVCLAALVHRFRYAADLTDESFSMALPYRFVLGDKPFVDEVAIQQTAGLVLFPFVWLFVKLTGGTAGLVLYVRLVGLFVFKGAAALAVYAAARRWLKHKSIAVAVAFVPFAFVPHSIPNVGYNLIGMALLTAGTFLTAAGAAETTSQKTRLRLFFLAGLAEGIMAFAYPPMGVAAMLGVPLVLLFAGPRRWSATGAFIAGGLAAVLMVLPSLAFGGITGVRRALGWGVHAGMTHNSARLDAILQGYANAMPTFFVYAVVALGLAWILRSRSLIAIIVPAITVALGYWFRDEFASPRGAIHTVMYTGTLAPALIVVARPNAAVWRGFVLVVVPSFAAALAAAFVSTQGVDASALGLAAAVALFALLAARALEGAQADPTYCMLPAFALMLVLVTRCYDFVYRDGPLATLTQTVANGPFKGIRTTPDRAQAFAEMHDIAKRFDQPPGRILFLYEASGYYLFSKMRPNAHSVWQEFYGDQDGLLAYWQNHLNGRGIVVKIKGSGAGRIDPILTPPERKIYETRHFIVYADH